MENVKITKRILIVDDEELVRTVCRRVLETTHKQNPLFDGNLEIVEAFDLASALDEMAHGKFDFYIFDMRFLECDTKERKKRNMPVGEGLNLQLRFPEPTYAKNMPSGARLVLQDIKAAQEEGREPTPTVVISGTLYHDWIDPMPKWHKEEPAIAYLWDTVVVFWKPLKPLKVLTDTIRHIFAALNESSPTRPASGVKALDEQRVGVSENKL